MLPVPTVGDLATFTGRPVTAYTDFANQALAQATLMFSTLTKVDTYPDDGDRAQMAVNGILQMADRLYLEQPFAATKATPFNAETVGSYSYSKGSISITARALADGGELTGLFWWDLAVRELTQVSRSLVDSGSIGVFEHEIRHLSSGRPVVAGPADFVDSDLLPPRSDVEVLNPWELIPVVVGGIPAGTGGIEAIGEWIPIQIAP